MQYNTRVLCVYVCMYLFILTVPSVINFMHGLLVACDMYIILCMTFWCNAHISIAHRGANDVKKHFTTSKHKDVDRASRISTNLFQQSPIEDKATRAEILFANFVAGHKAADHFTHPTEAMFPDCNLAKAFS